MLFSCETEGTNQKTVISKDKKNSISRHTLSNKSGSTIYQYQLDGGIIKKSPENLPKCDFIVEVCADAHNRVFFIELKGKDIAHAFEQLSGTVELFCNPDICSEFKEAYQGSLNGYEVHPRIVATRIDKTKQIMKPHERKFLNQMKRLKSKYTIQFNPKEEIVCRAGNPAQTTDVV